MIVASLAAGLFTALVLAVFAGVVADGLWRPDAFDYAQIARELAEGRGFSSRQAIYALHLEFLRDGGLLEADWPNLHRFPLPSLLMAAGFRVFGVGDAVVLGYGIVFQAGTSALLFGWARVAIGLAPAVACVFLFTANGLMLELGVSGLSEPPVMFFFTLALFATWWQRRSVGFAACLLAGAALGLATLARTNALFVAPLFLVALAHACRARSGTLDRRRAVTAVAAASIALVAIASPWWLPAPGGLKWDLTLPWVRELTPPLTYLAEHPQPVLGKWWGNLGRLLRELPTLGGTFGLPLVAASGVFAVAGDGLRPLARLLVSAFVLNALLVSFSDFYLPRYHVHFLPGMMLLATGVVWQLLARVDAPGLRALLLACAVLAMADLQGVARAFRRVPASIARFDRPHWERIRAETSPDAVIFSDQSHAITWETGRRSVRLHYDRAADGELLLGVLAISDAYLPIDAVYLSRQFLRDPSRLAILSRTLERDPRFRREFRRMHQLHGGGLLFLR
jgi:4-amino-4-deoxy-L-arabinose transferase-like glycosyltransferase